MGQRLVFKCQKEGKLIATLYYHWSGYTGSIYYEAWRLVEALKARNYDKSVDIPTVQKMLLDIVQSQGGGVDGSVENGIKVEFEAFKALGVEPKTEDVTRNEGLISITEKGMESTIHWAEALEEFNFDDETFTNNEYYFISGDDEEFEYYEIHHPEDVPVFNHGKHYMGTVKWDEAFDAYQWFNSLTARFEGCLGRDETTDQFVFACE